MNDKKFRRYWLFSLGGVAIASCYPLYMGIRVIIEMLGTGTVLKENYPKYIIPYTPIAVALIIGMVFLPVMIHRMGRHALLGGSALSLVSFFGLELLFEQKVVVTSAETVAKLEDWQMFMCYQPAGGWGDAVSEYKIHTDVEILMGEYSPAFKLHFYLVSVVLILAVLNCFYGFAWMSKTGDSSRKSALILQSVSAAGYLGLCILACFTAFWRDGSMTVSPLSALLMAVFFVLIGVTTGVFVGSLLLQWNKAAAMGISAAIAAAITLLMYAGEMILLHGHLYRFGHGFFFSGIPGIILAPVDILVIIASGAITYLLLRSALYKAPAT